MISIRFYSLCVGLFSAGTLGALAAPSEADSSSLYETTYDALVTPGTVATPGTTDLLLDRPITGPTPDQGFALTGINDGLAGSVDGGSTVTAASIAAGFTTTNGGGNDTFYDNGALGGTTWAPTRSSRLPWILPRPRAVRQVSP
jgi:hypothetical protein